MQSGQRRDARVCSGSEERPPLPSAPNTNTGHAAAHPGGKTRVSCLRPESRDYETCTCFDSGMMDGNILVIGRDGGFYLCWASPRPGKVLTVPPPRLCAGVCRKYLPVCARSLPYIPDLTLPGSYRPVRRRADSVNKETGMSSREGKMCLVLTIGRRSALRKVGTRKLQWKITLI